MYRPHKHVRSAYVDQESADVYLVSTDTLGCSYISRNTNIVCCLTAGVGRNTYTSGIDRCSFEICPVKRRTY